MMTMDDEEEDRVDDDDQEKGDYDDLDKVDDDDQDDDPDVTCRLCGGGRSSLLCSCY